MQSSILNGISEAVHKIILYPVGNDQEPVGLMKIYSALASCIALTPAFMQSCEKAGFGSIS